MKMNLTTVPAAGTPLTTFGLSSVPAPSLGPSHDVVDSERQSGEGRSSAESEVLNEVRWEP